MRTVPKMPLVSSRARVTRVLPVMVTTVQPRVTLLTVDVTKMQHAVIRYLHVNNFHFSRERNM